MKKNIILLITILCILLMGCNNKFAKDEYDSVEKIVEKADRYAAENLVGKEIDGGYSMFVSKFDGRETLWTDTLEKSQSVEFKFSYTNKKGQAKIVHIDADGNVTTLIECMPETSTEEYITKTVSMPSGENRIKIVGYDVENMDLEMLVKVSKE